MEERSKEIIHKMMQRRLKAITLQRASEKFNVAIAIF